MGKYEKLGRNVALITLGSFASKILSFFMLPLYTAVLSTEEYGIADLITTTVNLLYPFFSLLMSESVMRFSLDEGKSKKQVFSIGIMTTVGGFVVMLLFSPLVLLNSIFRQYYLYFLLYYFFSTIQLVVSQFVKGIDKVWIFSLAGVFHTLCAVGFNILFLIPLKMGVRGYLLSLILSSMFTTIILWFGAGLNKYIIRVNKIDKKLLHEMWRYSLPMIPNSLSWWISNSSDKYMLTLISGVGVTGIYSVSQKVPSMFSTISNIFINAWQISAVDNFGSDESKKFFSNIYRQYSAIDLIIISAMICVCRILARFLFASEFYEGWVFVPILLVAAYFNAISAFLGTIYTSAKRTKMLFVSTVIAAMANIIFNIVLIPLIGAMGAAMATFISYFIIWLIRIINTRKILAFNINYKVEIVSFLLLITQAVLILQNNVFMDVWCYLILVLVIFINKSIIVQLFGFIKKNVGKHKIN